MAASNRSAVFTSPGEPLQFWDREVDPPTDNGLVVRITTAGVCGTDVHRLAGDTPPVSGPVCFGHEAVGTVHELGRNVASDWAGRPLAVGDPVYFTPSSRGCGKCYACTVDLNAQRCANRVWPAPADKPSAAGFQRYATLDHAVAVYRIPDGTPPEALIAFGCAMPTALDGRARAGLIHPGQTVVIQGSGPVGLASAMLARLSPARQVIVFGAPQNRLIAAVRVGADQVVSLEDTTVDERKKIVFDATDGRGADLVIEAAGVLRAFEEGLDLLAPDGRYVVQGLFSGRGTVPVDPVRINNRSITVSGSYGGEASKFARTVAVAEQYHQKFGFTDLITARFPLEQLEAAIQTVRTGEAVKAVVVPHSD